MAIVEPPCLQNLLNLDNYLLPYVDKIKHRYIKFSENLNNIQKNLGGIDKFTKSYKEYGIHVQSDNSIYCLEWAPNADGLSLVGDFNNWDTSKHQYKKIEYGKWELTVLANPDGSCPIKHNSIIKIALYKNGEFCFKLSPWSTYVTCAHDSVVFHQQFYNPSKKYVFNSKRPKKPDSMRIYEAHVGISSQENKINSYTNFADFVLPRIVKQGYNTIQLMAVMEHAYYASFGYQVTSFFAVSSRCGTPDELKYLIDKAHSYNIYMILDVVHSHASKNVADGLNLWDGSTANYFHSNDRGYHNLWNSRLFNYNEVETQRFLLSNLRWWIEEYNFDGFRFDGVTSMIYLSHGINDSWNSYDDYFNQNSDIESIIYLMLANYMLHKFYPEIITIAEEVSGMPALCRPVEEGGQGFDYRLAMAIPDLWIKILKHQKDEDWDINHIVHTLENRRYLEKNIAYCESHDQALVGDKTIAFWLMDKEMYDFMSVTTPLTPVIDRGIALHKMIRLITYSLGGEAWLNFIGNEFGHPEWLDFPRSGNNESYHYCRRQWNLVDDDLLRYKFLNNFDRKMNEVEIKHNFLSRGYSYVSWKHFDDKTVVFERAGLIFVFNFHPSKSFADYKIGVEIPGVYKLALNSDAEEFGGHNRLNSTQEYHTFSKNYSGRSNYTEIYIPSRVAIILEKIN